MFFVILASTDNVSQCQSPQMMMVFDDIGDDNAALQVSFDQRMMVYGVDGR